MGAMMSGRWVDNRKLMQTASLDMSSLSANLHEPRRLRVRLILGILRENKRLATRVHGHSPANAAATN